nr:DUF559 domain-containing protein [Blastococcus saxobsidens]
MLTRRQLEGPTWRAVLRGVYVHRDQPVTHELRTRAAVLLVPAAVVTGRSAAVLWGLDLARAGDDVELTLPRTSDPVRITGVRVRRSTIATAHVRTRRGLRVTTPEATATRLAGLLPADDAVAAADQLIRAGLTELGDLRRFAGAARGPGSARARRVAALADGLAESPQETRVRLLIGRSSLPPPVAQYPVRNGDRFVARVDFAWPEHKVAVEYDGLWHAEAGQFARDRQRLNRLQAAGWRVVFVTAADLRDPVALIARIAFALSS